MSKASSSAMASGRRFVQAANRFMFLSVGMVLMVSAGWMLVAAGGSSNGTAIGALVLGVCFGAWLQKAFR